MTIARQCLGKHFPAARDVQTTEDLSEGLFSLQPAII
jgi:hypothetical protein